ncbi:sulfotransferase 6B1 isoform X2 [Eleginops maclovinus]|uniref:sulfotransferase 6B1 isoform X2 n=1 Tax=Eleginops maclovinus TaxID=56733 RepID=UPI003080DCAA
MNTNTFTSNMQSNLQRAKDMSDEEKLYRYKGVLYPQLLSPIENLKALENFKAREEDILLVAYPKCGFNWMVGVVKKIIAEAPVEKAEARMPPLMEFFGPEVVKILVIFRNPKDTLVSFYHFSNKNPYLPSESWDSFFSNFLSGDVVWGSYFDHALAWEKRMDDPNVMIVTYEELKQDLSDGIRQISSFFGYSLTEAQVQQISHGSTFSAMKESSAISHGAMLDVIFRKGEVGDWKNHFTPEQSQEMDAAFNKQLAGTRLGAKLNYQRHCQ